MFCSSLFAAGRRDTASGFVVGHEGDRRRRSHSRWGGTFDSVMMKPVLPCLRVNPCRYFTKLRGEFQRRRAPRSAATLTPRRLLVVAHLGPQPTPLATRSSSACSNWRTIECISNLRDKPARRGRVRCSRCRSRRGRGTQAADPFAIAGLRQIQAERDRLAPAPVQQVPFSTPRPRSRREHPANQYRRAVPSPDVRRRPGFERVAIDHVLTTVGCFRRWAASPR